MDFLNDQEYADTLTLLQEAGNDPAVLRKLISRDHFVTFVRTHGLIDLFFFDRAILGYIDMIPTLHAELCDFATNPTALRKGYLIPRGHFKSSCITIGKNLQKALKYPDKRMCIYHEKAEQAEGFLGQIKSHIENNALLRTLYPERMPPDPIPKGWPWKVDKIVLPRETSYPEGTIAAKGAGGASQGLHYTDMTWDDLIGEEAAGNPEVMEKVIDWMKKGESLSVTPELLELDLIGTRWAMDDIYSWAQSDEAEVYQGMPWYIRSAIEEDASGRKAPIFPERFTMHTLSALARQDYYIFSCQYLNAPTSSEKGEFNATWLRYYEKTTQREGTREIGIAKLLDFDQEADGSESVPLSHMTVCIHCDPGPGMTQGRVKRSNRHSKSSIVVVGLAWPRRVFILHIWARQTSLEEYVTRILDYVDAYDGLLRCVSVEAHSWTHMVSTALLKEAKRREVNLTEARCKKYTKSANAAKEGRVRKLQPWWAHGHIFLEQGEHDLEREYRGFPLIQNYDIMDALAQGPEFWEPFPEPESPFVDNEYVDTQTPQDRGANAITGY